MSGSIFLKKNKKHVISLLSAEFAERVVKVKLMTDCTFCSGLIILFVIWEVLGAVFCSLCFQIDISCAFSLLEILPIFNLYLELAMYAGLTLSSYGIYLREMDTLAREITDMK